MQICGVQKLTLLDFPEHTACTVFTAGCNFRCPFCHNASLVVGLAENAAKSVEDEAFFDFLKKRQGILDGVAITGGEPLMQKGLTEWIGRVRALGYQIKLDTNGSFPDRLRVLIEEGLIDYVAMDIKNSPARYAETVGMRTIDLSPILESVKLLLLGKVDYEFRTTVVRELHTKADFTAIGKWIAGAKRYYLQQFKDSGELISSGWSACTAAEMEEFRRCVIPFVPNTLLRGV